MTGPTCSSRQRSLCSGSVAWIVQPSHVSSEVQPGGAQVGFIFASQSPHTRTTSKALLNFQHNAAQRLLLPSVSRGGNPPLVPPRLVSRLCRILSISPALLVAMQDTCVQVILLTCCFDRITPFFYIPPQAPLFSNPSYTSNLICWFLLHSSPSSSFLQDVCPLGLMP